MSYTKYKDLVESKQTRDREKSNLRKQIKEQEKMLEDLTNENAKLLEMIEEEKEKYKKYVKQIRAKRNESTKKWLNGYPDE